jgi:hypothetical protein
VSRNGSKYQTVQVSWKRKDRISINVVEVWLCEFLLTLIIFDSSRDNSLILQYSSIFWGIWLLKKNFTFLFTKKNLFNNISIHDFAQLMHCRLKNIFIFFVVFSVFFWRWNNSAKYIEIISED